MFASNKIVKVIAAMTLGLMSLKPVTALAAVYHSEHLPQGRSSGELTLASAVNTMTAPTDQEQILQDNNNLYPILSQLSSHEFSDLSEKELDEERAGFLWLPALIALSLSAGPAITATQKTIRTTGKYTAANFFQQWSSTLASVVTFGGSAIDSNRLETASTHVGSIITNSMAPSIFSGSYGRQTYQEAPRDAAWFSAAEAATNRQNQLNAASDYNSSFNRAYGASKAPVAVAVRQPIPQQLTYVQTQQYMFATRQPVVKVTPVINQWSQAWYTGVKATPPVVKATPPVIKAPPSWSIPVTSNRWNPTPSLRLR